MTKKDGEKTKVRRWRGLPTVLILLLLVLVPFLSKAPMWLPLSSERVDFGGDFFSLMLPWTQTTINTWQTGQIPTWTSFEGIGRPLISNIQAAVFYPGSWLLAIITSAQIPVRLLEGYLLLHIALGSLGMYWLARTLSLQRWTAAFVGFIFATCGFYLHNIPNLAMVLSASWVPFVIASGIRTMERDDWRWVPVCSFFIALSIISGLPQPTYYGVLFVILASIYFSVSKRSLIPLTKLVVTGLFTLAIAAHTLLPGLREISSLFRTAGNWKTGVFDSTAFAGRITSFFVPQAGAALEVTIPYSLFFGTIPLLLAVFGLKNEKLRQKTLIILAFCFFVLIGISEDASLDAIFNTALPGYEFFKDHARAGLLVAIFGSLLAAAGLERLRSREIETKDFYIASGLATIIAIVTITKIATSPEVQGGLRIFSYALLIIVSALAFAVSLWLPEKHGKAAIFALIAIAAIQLLFLSNTNNLRTETYQRFEVFKKQAAEIPRSVYPPRIRRELYWDWNALDGYFGLNAFMSGDSNQYTDLKSLWHAADVNHNLSDVFNVEYRQFIDPPAGTKPRGSAAFKLDEKNRLQRFDLSRTGKTGTLRIRIAVTPSVSGKAEIEAAVRSKGGTARSIPLGQINPPDGAKEGLIFYLGKVSFENGGLQLDSLWVKLVEGFEARVHMISSDGGPSLKMPPRMELMGEGIYRSNNALPRAYLVGDYLLCADKAEMEKRLADDIEFDERALLLLSDTRSLETAHPFTALEAARASAMITEYSSHRVVMQVDSPRPALLISTDFFHPGWSAEIDGEPAEILRANLCARAVPVPAGGYTVIFTYGDSLVLIGMLISLLSVAGAAVIFFWPAISARLTKSDQ